MTRDPVGISEVVMPEYYYEVRETALIPDLIGSCEAVFDKKADLSAEL